MHIRIKTPEIIAVGIILNDILKITNPVFTMFVVMRG